MVHRFFLFCFFLSLRKLMTIKSIKQRLYRYSRLNANTNKLGARETNKISIPLPRTCKGKKKRPCYKYLETMNTLTN